MGTESGKKLKVYDDEGDMTLKLAVKVGYVGLRHFVRFGCNIVLIKRISY